jgi:hypothetical protein
MGVKVTARLLFPEPGQSTGAGKRLIALLLVLSLYLQSVAFVPLQARVKTAAPASNSPSPQASSRPLAYRSKTATLMVRVACSRRTCA